MGKKEVVRILGIDFFNGSAQEAVTIVKSGGLLVVPAAPALINVGKELEYYRALTESDLAIPDSGYMVLIWNLFRREKLKRISGWKFLTTFLGDRDVISSNSLLLVDPRPEEAKANLDFLNKKGFKLDAHDSYIAPWYVEKIVEDEALLKIIEAKRPKFILINLAGGVQEKLGLYLKETLSYKPAIICTGAAIAFLTGRQANMPSWADRLFLGWLVRCIDKPNVFIPRYIKAFKLISIIFQYGRNAPGSNNRSFMAKV